MTTPELLAKAVLVIHGIGQQQPFQPLDSFVNGLRATLKQDGKNVLITHFMRGREDLFDQYIRVEASDLHSKQPSVRLDIYEFYWAPLTQGKASFAQIVRWLLVTGFTPVRRLAFNLPLLIQRAESRAELGSKEAQPRPVAWSTSAKAGQSPEMSRLQQAQAAVAGSKAFWIGVEFLREIWRLVYVALVATAVVGTAVGLVSQSSALVKRIPEALGPALHTPMTSQGTASFALALVAAIAALALALSIPEQIRDLVRLQKVEPLVFDEIGQAARTAYRSGSNLLSKLLGGAFAGVFEFFRVATAHARWRAEIRTRRWLLPLSIVILAVAASVVTWLSLPSPGCIIGICPKPVVYGLLAPLVKTDLILVLLLLGFAFVLKRMFVDYLGDVALYTTADQNSAFYATRTAIRTEATRRVRHLLRDKQYASVAIAGHSLGSVIGYDAINLLRAEAKLPPPTGVRGAFNTLERLVAKLGGSDADEAKDLLEQLERAVGEPIEPSEASHVTIDELARLKTFITFGSPLNKVLYFFRVKINIYETIRSHIVQEIHGYRQMEALLTRDSLIRDLTTEVHDELRWVNVYSPMDPVSGRLVLYSNVIEHRHWYVLWGKCHMSYWHDPKMYREILNAL